MGVDGNAILAGILGGFGGFGTQVGGAMEAQRQDTLARDKLRQEQEYRDAMVTLERDKVNRGATPIGDFFKYLGMTPPAGIDPATRVPNAIGDNLIKAAMDQQKTARDTQGRLAQADLIRQSAQGTPAELTSQLAPGEDPEAAALIPRTPGTPPPANAQERLLAAGLHEKAPLGSPLLEKILGMGEDTWKAVTPHAEFLTDGRGNIRPIQGALPKAKEPPNYAYIHGALAEAGWTPDMKGYNTEFTTQLQQPVPIPQGGKATSRSEGIRPPSFYGNPEPGMAPGNGAPGQPAGMPGASAPRFRGEPATVPETTALGIANAVSVRHSTNQMYEALKNPDIVNNYIGPYAQYWSKIQGGAPNEMLGKKPPDLISLEQNLANLENYTIRLITGAAVREAEEPRIRRQIPSMANQSDEFKQKLTWTINNNSVLENQIRTLALQGDTNAKAAMAELGLDKMQEVDVPRGPRGAMEINRNARPLPKLQPGERLENGEIVSESGQYAFRNGQWVPR